MVQTETVPSQFHRGDLTAAQEQTLMTLLKNFQDKPTLYAANLNYIVRELGNLLPMKAPEAESSTNMKVI